MCRSTGSRGRARGSRGPGSPWGRVDFILRLGSFVGGFSREPSVLSTAAQALLMLAAQWDRHSTWTAPA